MALTETRFAVRDTAWPVSFRWTAEECRWYVGNPVRITAVAISYEFITSATGERDRRDESNCFAAYEEAQAECDRRNSEPEPKGEGDES